MKNKLAFLVVALLAAVTPSRAELLEADLSIFGMD